MIRIENPSSSDRRQATRDMENIIGYKKLTVYNRAHALTLLTYKITAQFPKEELFGLTSQMRRCAMSIPANIVEGYARRTPRDKLQFYFISRGSLTELEYFIDLSRELQYVTGQEYEQVKELRSEVGRLLNGFIRSIV